MVRGHIFLNTSLTEAFCMAIVEAASCGLLVVSTKVGGIPEVLPEDMILLSNPDKDNLTSTLSRAIDLTMTKQVDTNTFHDRVGNMYCWSDVASRTESVYLQAHKQDSDDNDLIARMSRYYGCGEVFGKIACVLVIVDYLLLLLLDWLQPAQEIDIAPNLEYRGFEHYSDWLTECAPK